ncbi:MAG: SET domain-containing protein-lysine N-methyltransferase [Archangium sp.]|nr:SET domain-containing protein-lysine N-methyltransferase [Archangium sp.]
MAAIPGLRVFLSSVHGYGVRATHAFKEGDLMADIEGVVRREGEQWDDRYTLRITDSLWLDMVDQTRWINHSCTANAEVDLGVDEHGAPWAKLYAWRDIAAGEEVTWDYEFPASLAEPCSCGSAKCRGWIVREEELSLVLPR